MPPELHQLKPLEPQSSMIDGNRSVVVFGVFAAPQLSLFIGALWLITWKASPHHRIYDSKILFPKIVHRILHEGHRSAQRLHGQSNRT